MISHMDVRPDQQSRIDDICPRYGVRRLSLFGSMAAGTPRSDSDVDVLVEFEPGLAPSAFRLVDLQDELSAVFDGRPVDLAFASVLRNPFRRRATEPQLKILFT
jgi:predicted nucleotidyltransferase